LAEIFRTVSGGTGRNHDPRALIRVSRVFLLEASMNSTTVSKINWTQAVAFFAMVATLFGVDVPDDIKLQLIAAIQALQSIITWVLHTWFPEVQ
jgi:hypothetical protein